MLEESGSVLDYVMRERGEPADASSGARDRASMSDYLDSVREVERRMQKMMAKQ